MESLKSDIIELAKEIYPQLEELLQQQRPELLPLYQRRLEYLQPQYPETMRIRNAWEIVRTYIAMVRK